jgi:3-dehydroquinate synthase
MADEEFFKYLEKNMDSILKLEKEACDHISYKNCEIKYKVVMKDEKESGLREILNLGHTVGRAIETCSDYRLLHGEAVSIGLVAQTHLSRKLGYMDDSQVVRVRELLKKAALPVEIPDYIDKDELLEKLYTDKKVRDSKLRFVVQYGIGSMVEFDKNDFGISVSKEEASEILDEI